MRKYLSLLCVVFVLFLIACEPVQQSTAPKAEADVKPATKEPAIEQKQEIQPKQEIAADVEELLNKPKTRVSSIYYKYKGPETGNNFYDFYIKGDKTRYLPALEIKTLDRPESYDTIFIDTKAKTAASYCMAAYCLYKGKKQDLNYNDAYISTALDWISGLTQAKKVGEEVVDSRSTWKLETSKGIQWVDTFYGIPLKVESNGKTYRYQQISVNSVQDSDVVP